MEPCPVPRWARPVSDAALRWWAAVPYSQLRDCRGGGSDPPRPGLPGIGSTVMATRLDVPPELDRRRIACLVPNAEESAPRHARQNEVRSKGSKEDRHRRQRPGTIKAMIRNKKQSHSERNRCGHSPGSPPVQCIPVPQLSASSWRKYPCPDGAPGATARTGRADPTNPPAPATRVPRIRWAEDATQVACRCRSSPSGRRPRPRPCPGAAPGSWQAADGPPWQARYRRSR